MVSLIRISTTRNNPFLHSSLGLLLLHLLLVPQLVQSQIPNPLLKCSSQTFTNNRLFNHCSDLSHLDSFLHWTYDSSNSTLDLAFIAKPPKPDGWIAWAINLTPPFGMVGSQCLIAFKKPGSSSIAVKTFNVSSYQGILPSKIAFEVPKMEGEYVNGEMRMYATLVLPHNVGPLLNHVWQVGSSVTADGVPTAHDFGQDNLNALGKIDLLKSGKAPKSSDDSESSGGGKVNSNLRKKNIHGILNAVSWGIMFPVGVVIARYLRTFKSADPAWFYLHVFCQFSAYVVGVSGWGTGLKLGSQYKGFHSSESTTHRNLGIALFSLATLQIFALFLRPSKEHKYRVYWNVYHHGVGYAVLILGIINVFKGLAILDPAQKWKTAYIILLIVLGAISVFLEAITWVVVLRRKSKEQPSKP